MRRTGLAAKPLWPCAAALALLFAAAPPAAAQEDTTSASGWLYELRVGAAAHDVDGLWSGTHRENGVDWFGEVVFLRRGLPLPLGTLRPNLGATLNDHGNTSKLYAGLLWEVDFRGFFFATGVGAAVHDGKLDSHERDRKQLGSRVLFRIPLEVGYAFAAHHRLMFAFDHISNAYLARENQGLDTVGVRYGYRF